MISLKRSLDDIDRNERMWRAALSCYRSVISNLEKHTVPVSPELCGRYQEQLRSIDGQVGRDPSEKVLEESRAALQTELKEFAGKASQVLRQRERDIKEILAILAVAAETLNRHTADYGVRFHVFARKLEGIGELEDLGAIRKKLSVEVTELKSCVGAMCEEGLSSVSRLKAELQSFHERVEAAEALAARDPLTGLINRREGERRLEQKVRDAEQFCLMIFDLDGFKNVNDRWGHFCGDQVLKLFAQRLAQQLRSRDIVCRWGGDEFVVIANLSLKDAMARSKVILKGAGGRYVVPGTDVTVDLGVTVGVADYQAPETAEFLFQRADAFLYHNKNVKAQGVVPQSPAIPLAVRNPVSG